jgi:hypothetical protein
MSSEMLDSLELQWNWDQNYLVVCPSKSSYYMDEFAAGGFRPTIIQ